MTKQKEAFIKEYKKLCQKHAVIVGYDCHSGLMCLNTVSTVDSPPYRSQAVQILEHIAELRADKCWDDEND